MNKQKENIAVLSNWIQLDVGVSKRHFWHAWNFAVLDTVTFKGRQQRPGSAGLKRKTSDPLQF